MTRQTDCSRRDRLIQRAPFGPIVSKAALAMILAIGLAGAPVTGDARTAAKKAQIGVLGLTPLTAKALGLTIPPSLRLRADQIIE